MYTNIAYLGGVHEDIVDKSVPLLVTAAGYYKVPHFVFLKQNVLTAEVIISFYM